MEISDVRVRLVRDTNDRLKAVCSVTMDDEFVVRDVKVVEGSHGLFVAMPSRKLTVACPQCRTQNHLRARFCNDCGKKLPASRIPTDPDGREKVHRDIAHPITSSNRQEIQQHVLDAYESEREQVEGAEDMAPKDVEPEVREEVSDETEAEEREVDERDERNEVDEPETAGTEADEIEVDEDEPESEAAREPSEYDSLIADLNGGSNARGCQQGGGGQERNRSGDRQGDRPGRDKKRPPRDSRPKKETVSASCDQSSPADAPAEPARDGAEAFGAGLGAAPEEPVAVRTCSKKEAPDDSAGKSDTVAEPQKTDDSSDDSSAFGAGIL